MSSKNPLPTSVALEAICYAQGERGGAIRVFRSSEFGITKLDRRSAGDHQFRSIWMIDGDAREFHTYAELRKALNKPHPTRNR